MVITLFRVLRTPRISTHMNLQVGIEGVRLQLALGFRV